MTGFSARIASLALSIGLIASLNRAEDVATPSLPVELTTTVHPVTAAPKIPAIKVDFCVPCLPIRMVLASPAAPSTLAPISMLLLPVVRLPPALLPSPMLLLPLVLLFSAWKPAEVLSCPVVLFSEADRPSPVLLLPAVFLKSAADPVAVLLFPVVFA